MSAWRTHLYVAFGVYGWNLQSHRVWNLLFHRKSNYSACEEHGLTVFPASGRWDISSLYCKSEGLHRWILSFPLRLYGCSDLFLCLSQCCVSLYAYAMAADICLYLCAHVLLTLFCVSYVGIRTWELPLCLAAPLLAVGLLWFNFRLFWAQNSHS